MVIPQVETSELIRVYGEFKRATPNATQKLQHHATEQNNDAIELLIDEVKKLRKEQLKTLTNRLECKQNLTEKILPETKAKPEDDPQYPKEIQSLNDLLKRQEIREKYNSK